VYLIRRGRARISVGLKAVVEFDCYIAVLDMKWSGSCVVATPAVCVCAGRDSRDESVLEDAG
jgi:hypothetical protein